MTVGPRDPVAELARAVLYEGYVLWPYRRSALKNRRRWTFGGIHPRAWSEPHHPDDRWAVRAGCLVEAESGTRATLDVSLRFLQVVRRTLLRDAGGGPVAVDALTLEEGRVLAWEEAAERELALPPLSLSAAQGAVDTPLDLPQGSHEEARVDTAGAPCAVVRSWRPLKGRVRAEARRLDDHLVSVAVRVENTTPWSGPDREDALHQTLASAHLALRVGGGAFVSLTDPPERLRAEAGACVNEGLWPVLVGEPGSRDRMLAAPIILEDHPRIAPESPGDLFDGGEIDELLVLNILGLTDEEKEEMRATDPLAREILERTAALDTDRLLRLHGAVRELRPAGGGGRGRGRIEARGSAGSVEP